MSLVFVLAVICDIFLFLPFGCFIPHPYQNASNMGSSPWTLQVDIFNGQKFLRKETIKYLHYLSYLQYLQYIQ